MKTIPVRSFVALCLAMGLLAAFPASPAYAATITVANCDDSGAGSLRQAVLDAVNGDTINFGLDCPTASPITLTSYIDVNKDLTISGAGHDIVLNGNNATRILLVQWGKTVTLEYLTLKNGAASGEGWDSQGGAIYDNGSYLTISHVTFDNNHAVGSAADGGAIYHNINGALTILNSAFSGNSAERYGGAIFTRSNTTITDTTFTNNTASRGGAYMTYTSGITSTFERVTMNGNTAIGPGDTYGQGGAIYLGFGTLNLYNSTLSGNGSASYTSYGGAIYTYDSTVTIKNSAIVENLVDAAIGTTGGLLINNSTLSYYNTIMANNAVDDCHTDEGLTVANNVNNLVRVSVGCGTPALTSDPNLGPLAANGGSTQTHALLVGSPAIDAGDNASCLATDQRGVARPQGAHCDIGAFEQDDFTAPTVNTFTVTTPSSSLNIPITAFTASDAVGVTGYLITESATVPAAGAAGWTGTAPTTYTVASDGSYTLHPWAKDAVGNVSAVFASPRAVVVDTTTPTVDTFTVTTPSNSLNIPITAFSASDAVGVTGYLITESATVPAAGAAGWTGTAPITYTVASAGSYTLYPWAKDSAGNVSTVFASPRAVVVDTTAPIVTSSTRLNPSPTNLPSVGFTVTFSESVIGVDAADFTLTKTGSISGESVTGVSGSGATYTVTVNTGTGSGALRLDIPDTAAITDIAGNPLNGLPYTSGEAYNVDKDAPTILSITRADPNPTSKRSVRFTVTFSESVTGVDTADFALTTSGISGASVSGVSGSGATRTVTVNTGTGSGTLGLNVPVSASVTDAVGNPLGGLPFTGQTYTVNKKLTFNSVAAQDGWVLESSETSNVGGTLNSAATTFNLGDDAADKQYRAILSFDTSALPDNAVITKVTLKIKLQGTVGASPFATHGSLLVDIRKGAFGGSNALQLTDFQAAASQSNIGSISKTPLSGWHTRTWTSGFFSYLNKTGLTQFRLRFSKDDNDDLGADYLKFYSGNASAAYRPQLIIQYYVP